MSQAFQLVERIRSDLRPLHERILVIFTLERSKSGDHRELLKVFAAQQYPIINHNLRSIALILSRQAMLPSRRFLLIVLQREAVALDALHAFAEALGLNVTDLVVLEPCQRHTLFVLSSPGWRSTDPMRNCLVRS